MGFVENILWSLKWDLLKQALLKAWVEPHKLEGVDFNNMEQLNQLAGQLLPDLFKSNPQAVELIKQRSSVFGSEKQKEIVDVIDNITK